MTPKSAKAKGRRLQNRVREDLIERLGLPPEAIRCRIMGETGIDLEINSSIVDWEAFPYAIECGNTETVNFWKKWQQATRNARRERRIPLLVLAKNRTEPVVALTWDHFLSILADAPGRP